MTAPAIDPRALEAEAAALLEEETPAKAGAGGFEEPLGYLLEEEDEKSVVDHVLDKLWKPWDGRMRLLLAQWTVNEWTRAGIPGVRVLDAGTPQVRPYQPLGASERRLGIPKADQLIRRKTATLVTDPPKPEAQPSSGEETDRDAAELCTRILSDESAESGTNYRKLYETCSDLASTYGSGFVWSIVDPKGGGWVPMQVLAHPDATTFDPANPDAVLEPPAPPPNMADPAQAAMGAAPMAGAPLGAGAMAPGEELEPRGAAMPSAEDPVDYVLRYVRPDGSLSESAVGARKVWRPAIRHRYLTGRQVRLIPETARSVEDADGVVIVQATTLAQLRAAFPKVAAMGEEDVAALAVWRPVELTQVLPPGMELHDNGKRTDPAGQYLPETIIVTMTVLYRSCAAYPAGARVTVGGAKFCLDRGTQVAVVGQGDQAREEPLMVPVSQFRELDDPTGANPYGIGLAQPLGPGDELRHAQLLAAVEYLFRFNNPNVYLPMGTTVQPRELARRDGTPIYLPPGGKPEYEDIPAFPRESWELYDRVGVEMDLESGLTETAQGLDGGQARSGIAKQLVVEQALAALSGIKGNMEDGLTRTCRVDLQLRRAYFTGEQLVGYTGEDGAYRQRAWTATDLGSTRDVKIARGTSTLLSRSAKQALAREELEVGLNAGDPEAYPRYQRVMSSNLDVVLGLEDNPHRLRIKRQIAAWLEGPGEEQEAEPALQAAPPMAPADPMLAAPPMGGGDPAGVPFDGPDGPVDPATGDQMADPTAAAAPMLPPGYELDPATGQPTLAPDPRAVALLQPLPCDDEPLVATIRHQELARTMAGGKYAGKPPAWRVALDRAYQHARQAAGVQTIAEQQAAAAAAAEQDAAAQGADRAGKAAEADADRAFQAEENDKDRAAAEAREQRRQAGPAGTGAGTPALMRG